MTKISVIFPIFENDVSLNYLQGFVNQNIEDIEIICIYKDSLYGLIDEFKSENSDSGITWVSQDNKFESILKCAKGEYIYFADSDENFNLEYLNDLYHVSEEKNTDMLLCNLDYSFVGNQNIFFKFFDEYFLPNDLIPNNVFSYKNVGGNLFDLIIATSCNFFKNEFISDYYFLQIGDVFDNHFFIELMFNANRIYFYDKYCVKKKIDSLKLFDIIPVSNLILDISKKYDYYDVFKDKLYNKKILKTCLNFINCSTDFKKDFFNLIKNDLDAHKIEIEKFITLDNFLIDNIFENALKINNFRDFDIYLKLYLSKRILDKYELNLNELHKNDTARIDIKYFSEGNNSFEIINNSDDDSIVKFPPWLNSENTKGMIIQSYKGHVNLQLKAIKEGKLKIWFRGVDLRDKYNTTMKTLVEYNSITINDESYLDFPSLFWHDEAFVVQKDFERSEIIDIDVKWVNLNLEDQWDYEEKRESYKNIRKRLLDLNINNNVFKRMPLGLYGFYIKLLNFDSYDSFNIFDSSLKKDYLFINKKELDLEMEHFEKMGIRKDKREKQIIVSLTSFPERMEDIHYCLYSLLNQNFKPDEVVLWLANEQFPNKENDIPQEVLKLKNNGLTIKWCKDIKSYKKLIYILKEQPNDFIVNVDDDIFYPADWLEKIWNAYIEHPNTIISSRPRVVSKDSDNNLLNYNKWDLSTQFMEPSFLNFPTGAGGTMYFPGALSEDIFDEETFMDLCPSGDDIWFWAMAIRNKTKITGIDNPYNKLIYVNVVRELGLVNRFTLWNLNQSGKNDVQIKNMINRYPEILKIIGCESHE